MSEKPVTREELDSAIRVIETAHGFDDETTAVGEAWRVVRIVLSRLDAERGDIKRAAEREKGE